MPQQDEENQIKSQFKAQAVDEDSDADDFLKVKKADNESIDESDGQEVPVREKKASKGEMKLVTDTELLARFYGENDELDHNERFLKNYILNEGWKEKSGQSGQKKFRSEAQDPLLN